MNLIGRTVEHRRFGRGVIKEFDGDNISVYFLDLDETRDFVYPQCFQGGLSLVGLKENYLIDKDIKAKEEEKAAEKAEFYNKVHNEMILNSKGKTSRIQETQALRFATVDEFCDKYTRLLQAEIMYLKKTGGKHITVYDGKLIQQISGRFYYEFDSEGGSDTMIGSGISIYWNSDKIPGVIENCYENSIVISTEQNLNPGGGKDDKISSLEYSVEGWMLLEALIERLEGIKTNESEIPRKLITMGLSNIESDKPISKGQDKAVSMSYQQDITFIWGPPGTGKTETLAKIAKKHMLSGHRVLMVSYSNVSVDGAIQRVLKHMEHAKPGSILRYGYPKDESIKAGNNYSYNYALISDPALKEKSSRLKAEQKTERSIERTKEIRKQLKEITAKTAEREKQVIKEAAFVATTISKAMVDKAVFTQEFDVVIIDEASMSYVPQIIACSGMAKSHFICMGDFNQLPPIVQGDGSDYLSVDIFKHCGIHEAVSENKGHKWLCMLDTQYRMHPQIADIASRSMYFGLLKTGEGIKEERSKLLNSIPELKEAYGLADLSFMMSTCIPMKDHSRANILSAFMSFALASRAGKNYDVGIITPYTSQARLLKNMAKDYEENVRKTDPDFKSIPCATVHQFQGSEKDVIVYDAVDCYRQQYPGVLLTNLKDNYANKLFNVALTRARGKFALVTNSNFMLNKGINNNLIFGKTINLSKPSSEINGSVLSNLKLDHDFFQMIEKSRSIGMFIEDIRKAKDSIYIDIPDPVSEDESALLLIRNALMEQKKRGVKTVVRAENRQNLPKALREIAIEHSFVMTPIAVIDKKTTWYGMPWSGAQFKLSGNKTVQTKYYPIIRFVGKHTARCIYGILELNKTTDETKVLIGDEDPTTLSQYILKHSKCTDCGSPMMLKSNKRGLPFLSCTAYPKCTYVDRNIDSYTMVYIEQNGITCPRCKQKLEVKQGRLGTFVKCLGPGQHIIKLDEI